MNVGAWPEGAWPDYSWPDDYWASTVAADTGIVDSFGPPIIVEVSGDLNPMIVGK